MQYPPPTRYRTGVAVGKFNPPHLGHLQLVATGAGHARTLYILLAERPDQSISGRQRAEWLVDAAPDNVEIIVTPDDLPAENEPWAERVLAVLPVPPDVAFTSEPWGPGWADAMGATHISVDQARSECDITATRIRADLRQEFRWLVPAAKAALAKRVVVVGAESTGKTTTASRLADEMGAVWVPEHGRWYWEGRRHAADQSWSSDEFSRIARAQQSLEDDLARKADRALVVADTNALTTAVWHRRYLGRPSPELEEMAKSLRPDLYLVCAPDFDWVQDGTRESIEHRAEMHDLTTDLIAASGVRSVELTGSISERLRCARDSISGLLNFPPIT